MTNLYLVILIVILLGFNVIEWIRRKRIGETDGKTENIKISAVTHYQKKNLLTKSEYAFWIILNKFSMEKGYIVCPKVRMEDFLNVINATGKDLLRYRGYIKSRHIDFILCDSKLHMVAAIELDDKSHQKANVKENDLFKDKVFEVIGVRLFRIQMSEGKYEEQIKKIMDYVENADNF